MWRKIISTKLACMFITCQFILISSEFPFKLVNICIPFNSQQTIKYSLQTASILFVRLDDLVLFWFLSRKHITNQPHFPRELRSSIVFVWKAKLDGKAWKKHIQVFEAEIFSSILKLELNLNLTPANLRLTYWNCILPPKRANYISISTIFTQISNIRCLKMFMCNRNQFSKKCTEIFFNKQIGHFKNKFQNEDFIWRKLVQLEDILYNYELW
jgi:hypothetical protein